MIFAQGASFTLKIMIFDTTVACFSMGLNVGGGTLDPFGGEKLRTKGLVRVLESYGN